MAVSGTTMASAVAGSCRCTVAYMPEFNSRSAFGNKACTAILRVSLVDPWLDAADPCHEYLARRGIYNHLYLRAGPELRQLLLRHSEIDIEGGEPGQRRNRVARIEVLPHIDTANTNLPGERRTDRFLLNACIQLVHRRHSLVIFSLTLLQ